VTNRPKTCNEWVATPEGKSAVARVIAILKDGKDHRTSDVARDVGVNGDQMSVIIRTHPNTIKAVTPIGGANGGRKIRLDPALLATPPDWQERMRLDKIERDRATRIVRMLR
jgi:hypothetical protein